MEDDDDYDDDDDDDDGDDDDGDGDDGDDECGSGRRDDVMTMPMLTCLFQPACTL